MCFRPPEIAMDKVCPECGLSNNITEEYCTECGAKLPDTSEALANAHEIPEGEAPAAPGGAPGTAPGGIPKFNTPKSSGVPTFNIPKSSSTGASSVIPNFGSDK